MKGAYKDTVYGDVMLWGTMKHYLGILAHYETTNDVPRMEMSSERFEGGVSLQTSEFRVFSLLLPRADWQQQQQQQQS